MARFVVVGAAMRASLLLPFVLAWGCSSYGFTEPKAPPIAAFGQPPPGFAQVCVLRPHLSAAAVTFVVRDNGRLVGATRGASYFCYYAQPGRHRVTSEADDVQEANVVALAGARYFLHQRVRNTLGWVSSPMEWVGEPEAQTMIGKCDYRVLTEVPEGTELPPANPTAAAVP